MGIRGLQFYVEKTCNDVCQRVNIQEMANVHRQGLQPNEKPIIVVDGGCIIRKLYTGNLDWVYGGQWTEFVSLLRDFVHRFEAAGIELVFFFDGPVCPEKRQEWVSRRMKKAKEIEDIFVYLKHHGQQPKNENDFVAPASTGTLTRFALKYCCNVEVRSTVKEADSEIAEYARNNNKVMAILAQDSDYLIFDTKPYLSMTHLDLDNLTTILYDRTKLASRLSLTVGHLPLFSCLLGNDVIPVEMVKPFHRKICQSNRCRGTGINDVAPLVSKLIRRNRWRGDFRDSRELQAICEVLFGVQRNVELIRGGILFYFLNAKKDSISPQLRLANHLHVNCEALPAVYGLLTNFEFDSSEVLEDCTDTSLPPVNLTFQPIRQRAYSILFEGSGRNIYVKEWCSVPRKELFNPELIQPIPIRVQGGLPSLDYLWSNRSPEADNIRMECFLACLGGSLTPKHVYQIKRKYVTFCCMMNYLLAYGRERKALLAPWEVAAFVAQAICPQADDPGWLNSLMVQHVETRAVHLASLLMRGISTFGMVLGICGYPLHIMEVMPWNFFNGKLFHLKYLRAKAGAKIDELCENRVELIEEFHNLMSVITFGTPYADQRVFSTAF